MGDSVHLVAVHQTKEDAVLDAVSAFLKAFLLKHFPAARPTEKRKVDQTAAAKALGVSQAHVSDMYNRKPGKRPGLDFVIKLHEASGAPFDEIMGWHEVPRAKYPFRAEDENLADSSVEASSLDRERGARGGGATFRRSKAGR